TTVDIRDKTRRFFDSYRESARRPFILWTNSRLGLALAPVATRKLLAAATPKEGAGRIDRIGPDWTHRQQAGGLKEEEGHEGKDVGRYSELGAGCRVGGSGGQGGARGMRRSQSRQLRAVRRSVR